ncbi:hypothetical protein HKBW3S34_00733 [Candidatus Hakubella thermalkaliphila]|uniref:Uncharacterized protein n=1 Tax=Candidatus Hakubella thermalkaliphila TaxID=2754717 RepID=A0A6V8PAW7_9ACTN|nr:hypothetical protein HKBW3S34_00733 [Candidatus Hakubella thermalkaliphila]
MLITERYKDQIHGVLSCYDRVVLRGTLPGWSYAQGMTSFLYANQIRIFDYPSFAQPLRGENPRQCRTDCRRERIGDRAYSKNKSLSQGRPHSGYPERTGNPSWPGAYLLGNGKLFQLQTLA